ncbi:hypothetical protein [Persephonella sp.]
MIISEQLIDAQDKLLLTLGKALPDGLISGSFGLVRAYTQHRTEECIDIYLPQIKEDLPEIKGEYTILEEKTEKRWSFPVELETKVIFLKDKSNINLRLCLTKDVFGGRFDFTRLEIGLKLEDLEGIYHRVLTDYINNPDNLLLALDTAYIDNEYHLVDFFSVFQETLNELGRKITEEELVKTFSRTLESIKNNPFQAKRVLTEKGVNISESVLRRWLEAKIQEFSE